MEIHILFTQCNLHLTRVFLHCNSYWRGTNKNNVNRLKFNLIFSFHALIPYNFVQHHRMLTSKLCFLISYFNTILESKAEDFVKGTNSTLFYTLFHDLHINCANPTINGLHWTINHSPDRSSYPRENLILVWVENVINIITRFCGSSLGSLIFKWL